MRRVVLAYFPRESVASLSGKEWVSFLNKCSREKVFTDELHDTLLTAPYQQDNQRDLDALIDATHRWLTNLKF